MILIANISFGQIGTCDCVANVASGNVNFSTLTWAGSGCPTSSSTSYEGNLCVNLANGSNLIMNIDFEIKKRANGTGGGFGITNTGNSRITIPSGSDLVVQASMGDDANNNVTFAIDGSLTVFGTLYGKNSNAFDATGSGTGTVTAGGLDFNQAPTCNPANCGGINWNVTTCNPSGTTFCNTVTPVTLLYFGASVQGEKVLLNWATATEKNSSFFSVEKSVDGVNFKEIGQQTAAGNSFIRINYSFTDKNPTVGRSYYRLKAVDFDGYTEYFNVDIIDYSGKRAVTVYPNPYTNENITIALNFSVDENASAEIFDVSGQHVTSFHFTGNTFTSALDLKPGVYIVKVTTLSGAYLSRFVAKSK